MALTSQRFTHDNNSSHVKGRASTSVGQAIMLHQQSVTLKKPCLSWQVSHLPAKHPTPWGKEPHSLPLAVLPPKNLKKQGRRSSAEETEGPPVKPGGLDVCYRDLSKNSLLCAPGTWQHRKSELYMSGVVKCYAMQRRCV